jgi:hypothetical protein
MRWYYYVLYKAFQFRKALPQSKSHLYLDTAGLASLPLFPVSVLIGLEALKLAVSVGLDEKSAVYPLAFSGLLLGPLLLLVWLNYRLTRSTTWLPFISSFRTHSFRRRLAGSVLVFVCCVSVFGLGFAALIHLNKS